MAKKRKRQKAELTASSKPTATKSVPRRTRKQSTKQERARVLAAAEKEGLTALQVQKRFGVKPVTYYSWRKAVKLSAQKGRSRSSTPVGVALGGADLAGQVRQALRAEIARMLPALIQAEVGAAFGRAANGRRTRRA